MKILLFDPWTVGHHINYAEHLARYLIEQGDDVGFATLKPVGQPYEDALRGMASRVPSLTIQVLDAPPASSGVVSHHRAMLTTARRGLALAGSKRVDVFHHLYLDHAELSFYLAMRGRHHRGGLRFATAFKAPSDDRGVTMRGLGHRGHWFALARMLSRGDLQGLFVHSPLIRETILAGLRRPDLAPQISVVPDPVTTPISIPRDEARGRLDISERPMLLFFGELRESKGVRILLEALPLLRRDRDWQVVIAGAPTASGTEQIDRCVELLDRPDRLVTHLRYIHEDDIDLYFAASDGVLLPFLRSHRGTSGILQRASAAARPVIASDSGDVGRTVRQYDLGAVFEAESPPSLADAIERFLDDRESVTQRVAASSARYAARSDWRVLGELVRGRYLA